MRRAMLALLGFTGAFIPLMSLSVLGEAVGDGLDGVRLPAMSTLVLNLAPIGPLLWIVPALISVGVYTRASKKASVGDALWALLAAILVFACVIGALMPAYEQFLFLDGPENPPHSVSQWVCNGVILGGSYAFLVFGVKNLKAKTEQ